MSRNDFVVTEIPGPYVMAEVLKLLKYSKTQMELCQVLKPLQFPLYVYQNPDTRYWFGNNSAMQPMMMKKVLWYDYISMMSAGDADKVRQLLESDQRWALGRLKDLMVLVRQQVGDM